MAPDSQTVGWIGVTALVSHEAQRPSGINTELNFEKFQSNMKNLGVIWAPSAFSDFKEFD